MGESRKEVEKLRKQALIDKLIKLGADPDELKKMSMDKLKEECESRQDIELMNPNGQDDE